MYLKVCSTVIKQKANDVHVTTDDSFLQWCDVVLPSNSAPSHLNGQRPKLVAKKKESTNLVLPVDVVTGKMAVLSKMPQDVEPVVLCRHMKD